MQLQYIVLMLYSHATILHEPLLCGEYGVRPARPLDLVVSKKSLPSKLLNCLGVMDIPSYRNYSLRNPGKLGFRGTEARVSAKISNTGLLNLADDGSYTRPSPISYYCKRLDSCSTQETVFIPSCPPIIQCSFFIRSILTSRSSSLLIFLHISFHFPTIFCFQ